MQPNEIGQNLIGQGIRVTWKDRPRVGVVAGVLASVKHSAAEGTSIVIDVSAAVSVSLSMHDLVAGEIESV